MLNKPQIEIILISIRLSGCRYLWPLWRNMLCSNISIPMENGPNLRPFYGWKHLSTLFWTIFTKVRVLNLFWPVSVPVRLVRGEYFFRWGSTNFIRKACRPSFPHTSPKRVSLCRSFRECGPLILSLSCST